MYVAYLIASLGSLGLRRGSRSAGHRSAAVGDCLLALDNVAHDATIRKFLMNMTLGLGGRASLDGVVLACDFLLPLSYLGDSVRLEGAVGHLG